MEWELFRGFDSEGRMEKRPISGDEFCFSERSASVCDLLPSVRILSSLVQRGKVMSQTISQNSPTIFSTMV